MTVIIPPIFMALLTTLFFSVNAHGTTTHADRPYKDIYGNSYKESVNLFKDKDKNGARNMYQKRDRKMKIIKSRRRR